MTRWRYAALLIVLGATHVRADDRTTTRLELSETEAIAASNAFISAWLEGKQPTIERMLSRDFLLTEDASCWDREQYLAPLRAGEVRVTSWTQTETRARAYGSVVVMTGFWSLAGRYRDSPYSHKMRMTLVWLKQADGTVLVAAHGSTIAKE